MRRISSFVPERLKKRVSGLSWHSSDATPHTPLEPHLSGALGKEEEKLPSPSSDFLSVLRKNPNTPARELVRPYLEYETALRKAFASEAKGVAAQANIVPVYSSRENAFMIRGVDRREGDGEKYLMPLKEGEQESEGALAIAPSLEDYEKNFDAFTHGVLSDLDWSNVVAAGSSALLPLLSKRNDVLRHIDLSVDNPREAYFEAVANTSDIDLFIYGLDSEEAAAKRILQIEAVIRKNQRLAPGTGLALRSENAVTFISPKYPHRHVQIILRLYRSISEILTGFDVDCSCVAYDGRQVYTTPRGVTAIATRTNNIDLTRRSPSYENRLYKYRHHGFEAYWDGLERGRARPGEFEPFDVGLAKLFYFEQWLRELKPRRYTSNAHLYRSHRYKRRIEDSGDPGLLHSSGYTRHELLFGVRITAARVREHVLENPAREPCMFGTVEEVVMRGEAPGKGKLSGKVAFIKDDPGRQMIGSFRPLTADDWTNTAYQRATPGHG